MPWLPVLGSWGCRLVVAVSRCPGSGEIAENYLCFVGVYERAAGKTPIVSNLRAAMKVRLSLARGEPAVVSETLFETP